MLIDVLVDKNRDSEIRAGAAWGLRTFMTRRTAIALIDTFNSTNTEIKKEAARALYKIAPPHIDFLIQSIKSIDPNKRDGVAWALAQIGNFNLMDLEQNREDINLRNWTSYIVGYGKDKFSQEQLLALSKNDPEVYFAASVLWQLLDSWIYNLQEY